MNQSDIKKPTTAKGQKQPNFTQTFESSIIQKQQKFMFDKTLVQGIKQNDSSKIVQNSQQRDLGQANQLYDEQKQIHEMFVNTRKDFDKTKQVTNKINLNLQKLKKQKQMLVAQKAKIEATFTDDQKQFKRIQQELKKLNDMCQVADYEKDIRLQMSQTLRQDILYYKKHCFQANGKILRNHNKLKTLNGQLESSKKVSSNCRSLIYSIQKKITQKQQNRYTKISSYHEIINKKMQNNIKRQQRQKMIEQSMLEALNGKMPEQQQQKKLLLANIVVKKMLKLKMQRQMQKYNQIETIFRKIKQNTTVKKADQFVDKFIKRQKNYGELLQSISKNEQKINKLKLEQQKLQKEHHQVMFTKQSIEDQQNEKRTEANKQFNLSIDMLRQKLLHNEFLKNKTISYVSKFIAAFDNKPIQQVKQKLNRQKPNLLLKQVLQKVNKFLDLINKDDQERKLKEIYIESKNLVLPQTTKVRNLRIKTVSTGWDQNTNSAMQNYDVAYDDVSERQFLNQNRKQIKKSVYLRNRIKTRAN